MKKPTERLLKAELQINCFGPAVEHTSEEPNTDLLRCTVRIIYRFN